jgi:SPP1 family predicted phage head-tail adaptor
MQAATLDRVIDIETPTATRDATGDPVTSWSTFLAREPAEYMPAGGAEQFAALQRQATALARFRIRFRTDLTLVMRLLYGDVVYDIRAIEEDRRFDRRQYLVITAEARPA